MRIILVTLTDQLENSFAILNPVNEYCAIVVDEVEPAQKILESVGLPKTLLYPFYDLKEFVDSHYYDALVCFHDGRTYNLFPENISKCGVPKDKFIDLCFAASWEHFLMNRALQYYKEHASKFEMFATGQSHTTMSLDVNQFKRKLFNFARGGQDIYYNYQIAKFAVLCNGGGVANSVTRLSGLRRTHFTLIRRVQNQKIGVLLNMPFLLATYITFGCLQKNI